MEHGDDRIYMERALELARIAASLDEVPIGAVVVCEGRIIAEGYNRREIDADPAGHAELIALSQAARELGVWRLSGCTVYVTLEPCLMCAGLMYQARVDRCVFGALDPKAGALGSLYRVNEDERLNHTFEVTAGVCADECAEVLRSFFREKRRRNKERKQEALAETSPAPQGGAESGPQPSSDPEAPAPQPDPDIPADSSAR